MRKKEIKKSLFGYKRSVVDRMIADNKNEHDFYQNELALVDGLKEENEILREKVKELSVKEQEVQNVLSIAHEKSKEMVSDVELQYALELERLKIFRGKWTSAYEELKNKFHLDREVGVMESVVTDVSIKMAELLYKDFGIRLIPKQDDAERQLLSEVERLSISQDEINKLVEKLKLELKKAS